MRVTLCEANDEISSGISPNCGRFATGKTLTVVAPDVVTFEFSPVSEDGTLIAGLVACIDTVCGTSFADVGAVLTAPRGGGFTVDVDGDSVFSTRHNLSGADRFRTIGGFVPSDIDTALGEAGVTAVAGKGHLLVAVAGDGTAAVVSITLAPTSGDGPFHTGTTPGVLDPALQAIGSSDTQAALAFNLEPGEYTVSFTAPPAGSCQPAGASWPDGPTSFKNSVGADRLTSSAIVCETD
ncbi:MAG: hypothetical protein ACI9MR_002632 [Myxococcota bacterium]|jgi:hypothetical protein